MDKDTGVRKGTDWFLVVIMNAGKDGIIGIRDGGDRVNRKGEREREREMTVVITNLYSILYTVIIF